MRTWFREPSGSTPTTSVPSETKPARRGRGLTTVPAAEVQQEVQRFAGRFTDRVLQAAETLASDAGEEPLSPKAREHVLRRTLLYESNALEIATGPVPDVNLLDMLVFVSLIRDAFDRYWGPEAFGARSALMLDALRVSEEDVWEVGERLLSLDQRERLRAQIEEWKATHPDQIRVEGIRLSDFAELVGDARPDAASSGLLSSVRGATETADQAVLYGERALFLAHRAPAVLRLHLRLSVQETLGDILSSLWNARRRLLSVALSVAAVGVLWIAVFWAGYFFVRR